MTADAGALRAARALVPHLPADAVATAAPRGFPPATLFTNADPAEDARRRTAGADAGPGAYCRIEQTALLLSLPVGIPVPLDVLSPADQAGARRLPPGAVRIDTTGGQPCTVTRLALRPATVHLALVQGPVNARTLARAGAFAPFCARAVLAGRTPHEGARLAEADFYGIGSAVDTTAGPEILVPAAPWTLRRHSPAGWLFTEQAYRAAVLAQET